MTQHGGEKKIGKKKAQIGGDTLFLMYKISTKILHIW